MNQDEDYLNEIAGTLCLREGKDGQAVRYLEKVSPLLQFRQGIYRDMVELERKVRTEKDADKRAMSGLEYEAGRHISPNTGIP